MTTTAQLTPSNFEACSHNLSVLSHLQQLPLNKTSNKVKGDHIMFSAVSRQLVKTAANNSRSYSSTIAMGKKVAVLG